MKFYCNLISFALLASLFVSCGNGNKDYPDQTIRISAGMGSTKAVLNAADLTTGSKVQVYDILGDLSYSEHINDIATYAAGPWTFSNEPAGGYSWIPGFPNRYDHNFFAWLVQDKDSLTPANLFGSSLSASHSNGVYTLNVPATTMTLGTNTSGTPQFDFCYSKILKRVAAQANYSTVNLPLKHFFSSFGIKAHNYDSDAITIKSVKLYGIKNRKSATLTFDTTTGKDTVIFASQSSTLSGQANGLELLASDITLVADEEVANIITCSAGGSRSKTATDAFFLMWPQTVEEMRSNYSGDNLVVDYTKAILQVTYTAGSGAEVTRCVSLCPIGKIQGWDAGTRHQIELSFTSGFINIRVNALPWEYFESEVDLNREIGLNNEGQLHFIDNTCVIDEEKRIVYFKNSATPIRAQFSLGKPKNSTWMITKQGDFDAFEIDNVAIGHWGDKVETPYGTVDGTSIAYFTIYPMESDPQQDYMINLSFAVRMADGNVISADEIVQGKDKSNYYTIVLQAY